MLKSRLLGSAICVCFALFAGAAPARAAGCEDTIARHMVGEAMLAAQFVAAAEKNGVTTEGINGILKEIAAKSAIEEFWITDSSGHAYLTNTGIDFTFSPDAKKQPQAKASSATRSIARRSNGCASKKNKTAFANAPMLPSDFSATAGQGSGGKC
jgi:hypothetical protein